MQHTSLSRPREANEVTLEIAKRDLELGIAVDLILVVGLPT